MDHMLNRRTFLGSAGIAIISLATPGWLRASATARWQHYPFTLGVASGSPTSDGFVLWTRIAPDPLCADPRTPGGIDGSNLPLNFEISSDEQMRKIIRHGRIETEARYAHSVHLQIRGLDAGRPYWYRFLSGEASSPIGRAMTLPSSATATTQLRLGAVSCAHYEQGYFSAYRHLADETPDLVLYLGDYIYEYIDRVSDDLVRHHSDGVEATDLRTYRNRYAQYRLDADLQRLHATAPALMTWDDHEVANDYGNLLNASFGEHPVFTDPKIFKLRRNAAYQAFYEHMPLRPDQAPRAGGMRIYGRHVVGNLAQILVADTRQYRSAAACYGPPDGTGGRLVTATYCPALLGSSRSMLGSAQEAWLHKQLSSQDQRWSVLAQSVLMAQLLRRNAADEPLFWTDDWNGYPASRQRLLKHLHQHGQMNTVVLGGDAHAFFANDLKLDFNDSAAPVVATEFVGTSVTSKPGNFNTSQLLQQNPHIHFFDNSVRGYLSLDIRPSLLTARYQAISDPRDPLAGVRTLQKFCVEPGHPGIQAA